MNATKTLVCFALLGLLSLCVALETFASEPPLRVGAILPLSGAASGIGAALRAGLLMAVEDINKRIGPKDRPIEIVFEDTRSEPMGAVSAFKKLTELKEIGIVLTITSSAGMALKPLAEKRGVLLFADVTHPQATKDSSFILRHSNIIEDDCRVMSEALLKLGPKRVGIFYRSDDWGESFNQALSAALKENDIAVVSEPHLPQETDFRTQLARTQLDNLGAIINISFGSAAGLFLKQLGEHKYNGPVFMSVGFVLSPDARTSAGAAAKGVYYQTYRQPEAFEIAYLARFGERAPMFSLVGYTDLELLAEAVRQTGSDDPAKLADFIKNLGSFRGSFEIIQIRPNGDIPVETQISRWGD